MIQNHIKKDRLLIEQDQHQTNLIHDYHQFVNGVGKHIMYAIINRIEANKVYASNAGIGEKDKNELNKEENANLKSLKNHFITNVKSFEHMLNPHFRMLYLNRIDTLGEEIYKKFQDEGDVAEKQMQFFLDYFVVNLRYIETVNRSINPPMNPPMNLYMKRSNFICDSWNMQMRNE
jgi:hypothetical protein